MACLIARGLLPRRLMLKRPPTYPGTLEHEAQNFEFQIRIS